MDSLEQAKAYAEADFAEPNERFISLFQDRFGQRQIRGIVADLGCGPADISIRFARIYTHCIVHAIDGSEAMLFFAKKAIMAQPEHIRSRIKIYRAVIPEDTLPSEHYDIIISNSLLHHLRDPLVLWYTVRRYSRPGTVVMVMDLMRPESFRRAEEIVETYSHGEPEILKRDFLNSLCAAFRPEEVEEQIRRAELPFKVEVVSDRHLLVSGIVDS